MLNKDEKGREIPPKTDKEKTLFNRYRFCLRRQFISEDYVRKFKKDLLTLKYCQKGAIAAILLCNISFAQSGVVVAGKTENNISYTIGGGLVPLQIEEITEEVLLGLPKFEKPTKTYIPKPKAPIKKPNFFQRLFKALFG